MADGSTKVVYAALAGNFLVALSKFGAAALSGSGAMLTEAIHSSADTVNQILLLIGNRRSRAKPDEDHAFGYGMEIYYWTLVVAVLVLLAGGAFSLYEGWRRLHAYAPIVSVWISLSVLGLSALFEGTSFAVGYREYKKIAGVHVIAGQPVGLWGFIKLSKDPNLYESLLEDGAALIGIGIATAGVIASGYFRLLWADGAASMAIGLLLVADSVVILRATQSLISGESVTPPLRKDIEEALAQDWCPLTIAEVRTLHLGPRTILVALTITPDERKSVRKLRDELDQVREHLKAVDPRITYVFLEVN